MRVVIRWGEKEETTEAWETAENISFFMVENLPYSTSRVD